MNEQLLKEITYAVSGAMHGSAGDGLEVCATHHGTPGLVIVEEADYEAEDGTKYDLYFELKIENVELIPKFDEDDGWDEYDDRECSFPCHICGESDDDEFEDDEEDAA